MRLVALVLIAACGVPAARPAGSPRPAPQVVVTLDASAAPESLVGRLFLFVTDRADREPRLVTGDSVSSASFEDRDEPYAPLFGMDVSSFRPGSTVVMSGVRGYPFQTFAELPAGDYYVQAVFDRYTRFARADGRVLWAHLDRGEGQQPHISPGNLYSRAQRVHVDARHPLVVHLVLDRTIPPIAPEPDTRFVKHLTMRSDLLSRFWGHDIEVGAVVVLPNGYYAHPDKPYPVLYFQGHFLEQDVFVPVAKRPSIPPGRTPEQVAFLTRRQQLWDSWHAENAPQLIVVSFVHPTPFYDSSYLVDSPVAGPYGSMVMDELIPKIEASFRIIRQPWARVLFGGSIGGWTAAALQIFHPDFFGGVWSACPDPVDFHHFYGVDLYDDDNAFVVPGQRWVRTERLFARGLDGTPHNTMRRLSQLHLALGSHGRSGELLDNFSASFGPPDPDGYPQPIWDHETGRIDHRVALAWQSWDLRAYLEQNWPRIGAQLAGKLRFFCGDSDQYESEQAMFALQHTLEGLQHPAYGGFFYFAPGRGHETVFTRPQLLGDMVREIAHRAPPGTDLGYLNVPAVAPLP